MFTFQKDQKIFEIENVQFGGQPGKRPPVLIGSLFYPQHSVVENRKEGIVDQEALQKRLDTLHQVMGETEGAGALMLYAETEEAAASYLETVSEETALPLLLDSPSVEVKLSGARRAREMGVENRIIYNTVHYGTEDEELERLQELGIESAVLLAFDPSDPSLKGKIYLLEDGGKTLDEGLIDRGQRYGIERPLLDLAVMSMDQNAGSALRGIFVAKAKWGLPCGCAPHNAVESWEGLARKRGEEPSLYRSVDISSISLPIAAGADFVIYGPIEYAKKAFYSAAFSHQLIRQAVQE